MTNFSRADRSVLALWWWTVDRWTLATIGTLMFMGAILVLAASPAVATRIGLDSFHMVRQHYVMLPAALALVIGISMLSPKQLVLRSLGRPDPQRSRGPAAVPAGGPRVHLGGVTAVGRVVEAS